MMSAIQFVKTLKKVTIPISQFEEIGSSTFISSHPHDYVHTLVANCTHPERVNLAIETNISRNSNNLCINGKPPVHNYIHYNKNI